MLAKNSEKEGMNSGRRRMVLLVRKRFHLLLKDSAGLIVNNMQQSNRRETNAASYEPKRLKDKRGRRGMSTHALPS